MIDVLSLTMNPSLDLSTSVDRVVDTNKLRCSPEVLQPGGGGINVARVVKELGGQSRAVFPSGGYSGQRLTQLLGAEGVSFATITLPIDTRQCFSVHETSTGRDFRFILPGESLSTSDAELCLAYFKKLKAAPRFLVASGSLPPGVSEDFYAELSLVAKTLGVRFVLDASGKPLARALESGGLFLIKPSQQELEDLLGTKLDSESTRLQAARQLVQAGGTDIVVLSLGEEGALLVTRELALRALAIPVQPLSTVGAGDSLVGGILWALSADKDLEDALKYGLACAAGTLLNIHSKMCSAEDVARLYPLATVTRL